MVGLASDRDLPIINRQSRFRGLGAPAVIIDGKIGQVTVPDKRSESYEQKLTRLRCPKSEFTGSLNIMGNATGDMDRSVGIHAPWPPEPETSSLSCLGRCL